jgi:GNAT superfamily N-acetyltransferase
VTVVTTYLEILEPSGLRPPGRDAPAGLSFERVEPPDGALSRRLYLEVGADWSWTDHAGESTAWWQAHAERVETWLARLDGELAGYAELEPQDAAVEIAYLGLLPAFDGRGIGGHLLAHAIRRGFELGTRVWVHTCTLDGPRALANYEARGMSVFRVEG